MKRLMGKGMVERGERWAETGWFGGGVAAVVAGTETQGRDGLRAVTMRGETTVERRVVGL